MKKRILQLELLVCVLAALFVALSVTASAASSGTCGDNLTWTLDDVGVLAISGEGTMYDYQEGEAPWDSSVKKIVSVEIENGVTSIGEYAFENCNNLTSVTIPDSVTFIGEYAFENCSNLTSVTIPDSVTSIGSGAFYGCSSLTSIEIPDSVTSIGSYAFSCCSSLISITIPNGVTSIRRSAFYGCSSLTSIEIPDSVTSIGWNAFSDCSSLTSIEIPDSVTSIENYAFFGCSSLTSVTIPDSVTGIGKYAFRGCSSLTSITLPFVGGSKNKDTYLGYIFGASSYSENSDYVPVSLTTVEITTVETIARGAFYGCSSLTSITVDEENESYSSDNNGVVFNKDKTTIIIYPAGKTETNYIIPDSVTSIGEYAFENCSNLTSVTIPDSVTNIGSGAFHGCSSLINITLPFVGGSTSKNTYIGYIFGAGSYSGNSAYVPASLTTVEITSGETIPSNAFRDCSKLTSIIIPDSVTNIEVDVFAGCTSLQEITLPFVGSSREANGTTDALFGYLFGNVSGIEKRQYYSPSNYTTYKIPSSLKSVTITDADVIPYGAFYNCSNLDNIILNSTVSTVYSEAFYNCSSLMKITIPAEKLKMASTNVFSGCDMLTIYGIEGSDVEEYATKYSIDFEPIGVEAIETTLTASAEIIGGNIVVTAKANGSTTDKFMPVAVYNKDNEMLDLIIIPSNEDFEVVKVVFKDIADASYVKLFLWDSYSDLTPLETAKEVGIAR